MSVVTVVAAHKCKAIIEESTSIPRYFDKFKRFVEAKIKMEEEEKGSTRKVLFICY